MKTTLLEKWNYYNGRIKEREQEYIKSEVKDLPEFLYYVNPVGTVGKKTITHTSYYSGKYFTFNKRPTKIDVEMIKAFAELDYVFSRENIHVCYEEQSGLGKSSSAVKLTELSKFLSEEQAEFKSMEIQIKNGNELILLQNGHTRCQRCRKVFPDAEIVKDNIIGRGRKQVWNSWKSTYENKACVTQTIMFFCSGKCAGEEQMSREG